jgi:hypothetical protein
MTSVVQRARQLEEAFLGGLEDAQTAYEEIVATQAWTELGYDTFAEWWTDRVTPTMRALSMRPTREIAASVVEQVRAEEYALPPAQRRTQRELAEMAGVHRNTLYNQDRPQAQTVPTPDLEAISGRLCDVPGHGYGPHRSCPETMPATDPLPPEIAEQIEQRIAEKVTPEPIQPADPAVRERLALEREEQQSRERYSRSIANCVWLLGEYALRVDAPNWTVDRWQPSQDIYPKKTTAERLRAAGDFLHALAEVWPK